MYPLGTWFGSGTYEGIPYIKEIKVKIIIIIITIIIVVVIINPVFYNHLRSIPYYISERKRFLGYTMLQLFCGYNIWARSAVSRAKCNKDWEHHK